MAHRTLAGLKCHKDRALFIEISSKSGAEYSNELPGMRKAFAEVPTNSAILDGELCLMDPRGGAYFYLLMHQMRTRWPEEGLLVLTRAEEILAFTRSTLNGFASRIQQLLDHDVARAP